MEEPNANEKERAMGFCTNTAIMQGISKGACRQILGQVLDFNLVLLKQLCFGQSHPNTPPHFSLVAPFVASVMSMQGGGVML
jgi:hypothetical protein